MSIHKVEIEPTEEILDNVMDFLKKFIPKSKHDSAARDISRLLKENAMHTCDTVMKHMSDTETGGMAYGLKLFTLVGFIGGLATGLIFARVMDMLS